MPDYAQPVEFNEETISALTELAEVARRVRTRVENEGWRWTDEGVFAPANDVPVWGPSYVAWDGLVRRDRIAPREVP